MTTHVPTHHRCHQIYHAMSSHGTKTTSSVATVRYCECFHSFRVFRPSNHKLPHLLLFHQPLINIPISTSSSGSMSKLPPSPSPPLTLCTCICGFKGTIHLDFEMLNNEVLRKRKDIKTVQILMFSQVRASLTHTMFLLKFE